MKDILPHEFGVYQHIIDVAYNISQRYGYRNLSTPILEYAQVFDRTLGPTSDIISKEMYCFNTKGGDLVTLRPEFTSSIMRCAISHFTHNLPLKAFSYGPLFRYDRPQLGRQRQFHQINFEYIGTDGAFRDAEIIKLAQDILSELGVLCIVRLEINSLGCTKSRALYQQKLKEYFINYSTSLSEDSLKRIENNPLRILDSKSPKDIEIVANAPTIDSCYTYESKMYFEQVLAYLELLKVQYQINHKIVRGLDYYCHTAFEYITDALGAQSAILGGGRYDGLSKIMSGPDMPSIGFAAGIERLALIVKYEQKKRRPIILIPISEEYINHCIVCLDQLRNRNLYTEAYTNGKVSKRMEVAIKNNAKYIIFIGQDEVNSNKFKVKDLDAKSESDVTIEEFLQKVL